MPAVADCGPLADIDNGTVMVSPNTQFGAVATYNCDPGYVLRGNDTRNCDADEQWDNSEPLCTRKDACITCKCAVTSDRRSQHTIVYLHMQLWTADCYH